MIVGILVVTILVFILRKQKCYIPSWEKFVIYLKSFMKLYYPKLYETFTFNIPRIIFVNKFGNIVKEKAKNYMEKLKETNPE